MRIFISRGAKNDSDLSVRWADILTRVIRRTCGAGNGANARIDSSRMHVRGAGGKAKLGFRRTARRVGPNQFSGNENR